MRTQSIELNTDTVDLDSLSIVPASEILKDASGKVIPDSLYEIDYATSTLIPSKLIKGQQVQMSYRVLPLDLSEEYYHKSLDQIEQSDPGKYDYFTIKDDQQDEDLFSISGLNKNGSISRGVSFGNNQDLAVNSNLDLQLSGRITDEISIQAAISDNNLPIQAEGNTQQLQEFDRVYIKLFTDRTELIAGDFLITRPESYFLNLNKKVQGGGFSTSIITKETIDDPEYGQLFTSINAAISRGKFSRDIIPGQEGNQGPYQLKGAEGESFIIVLSGTERVYVNGKLMKRGQDNDYIIDYNTAELTFTPNVMITKDLRIVVEFQYSEQNYSRSLIFSENQYKQGKWKVDLNIYSEQDHKNQPLQQDLTDADKRLMSDVGDNLNEAIISGIDTTGFLSDQVNYKLVDTLGFEDVLVFSKNPDSAIYTARFSQVGFGNGNYVQIRSDANGRVFQWVAPENGVPQGNYEPQVRLITPKLRQLFTLGNTYTFNKNTSISVEGAISRFDQNTFSEKDSDDDDSYGLKLDLKHSQAISSLDSGRESRWNSELFYEQRGTNFEFVERYRGVEFERDWNLQELNIEGNEYLVKASNGISKGKNRFDYDFGTFIKGKDYRGVRNGYRGNYVKDGFSIQSNGSFLTARSDDNSEFLRHYTTVKQKVLGFTAGGYLEQEQILFYQGQSDSLQSNSFNRVIWRSFLERGDSTSANYYRLTYGEIYDYFPKTEELNYALKSENFELDFNLAGNPNSRLSGKFAYRKLLIKNDELTQRDPENTLLGRLEYDFKAMKGFISSNTFYQIGSGLENQREVSFLEVNDGQGTHVWIDYNENEVKELNEFEVAGVNNQFQANYIKVFTPTNRFIRAFSNQFNQVLFLRPTAILKGNERWKKWLSRFSDKAAYRVERKTLEEENIYNPFYNKVLDSNLININSSFANTFYFNRLDPVFGMEFFYQQNKGKSLLTNGFESRSRQQRELRARYNLSRIYSIEAKYANFRRANSSEFFDSRDFNILGEDVEPTLIYQPSVKFRWSLSALYGEKVNKLGTEKSFNRTLSTELRFNDAGKGTFSLEVNFISLSYNAIANNSIAFEMLDGLSPGSNYTWTVLWQRNLSNNLQLNLNYNGRKSEDLRTIHTGGVQLRAFF